MKKLLLTVFLLSPFAHTEGKLSIRVIAYDQQTGITLYCISGYRYLQDANRNLIQVIDNKGTAYRCSSG